MQLVQQATINEFGVDALWIAYLRAFTGRRRRPSGASTIAREDFDSTMTDPRVTKLLVIDPRAGNRVAALATVTNDPSVLSASSLRELTTRWPRQLHERRVWHIGFLAVDPDYQDTSASLHLVNGIWARAAACGGVVALDVRQLHESSVRLATGLFGLARTFSPEITLEWIDGLSYWGYEFPSPVPA